MFKPLITVILLVAFCTAETPTRFRSSRQRTNTRFLARQQAAPAPTPTGYPAAGVTPEIPFTLPSSTVKPDVTYLPPDNTYGPPTQPDAAYAPPAPHSTYGPPDNTYLPPEDNVTERVVPMEVDERDGEEEEEEQQPTAPQPEVQEQPEQPAGAPAEEDEEEEEEEILVAVADDGPVIAVSNSFDAQGAQAEAKPARLVFQRFPQARRRSGVPVDMSVPARLIKMRRTTPAKLQLAQRMQLQPQPQGFSYVSQYTAW